MIETGEEETESVEAPQPKGFYFLTVQDDANASHDHYRYRGTIEAIIRNTSESRWKLRSDRIH